MFKRFRRFLAPAAIVAGVGAALFLFSSRKPHLRAGGGLDHFEAAYGQTRLPYHTYRVRRGQVPNLEPGLYFKLPSEGRAWDEIILAHQVFPSRAVGYALVRPAGTLAPAEVGSVADGRLVFRGYVMEGDPLLLRELVEALD
jgi:hypothetical protein